MREKWSKVMSKLPHITDVEREIPALKPVNNGPQPRIASTDQHPASKDESVTGEPSMGHVENTTVHDSHRINDPRNNNVAESYQ